ncbi:MULTISPECIES: hypothetical protein [unclassified Streptomyces]|uniref:hypothetical protein n=1 Tax=unclassified Streptomyces TaxID=2593676 RepID=UPI0029667ECD|nr:hypothetical protein [Streptomyces sp. SJL17-1]
MATSHASQDASAAPEESPASIARQLGIPPQRLTESVLTRITEDPFYLHHLEMCRTDPMMLDLLLGPETAEPAPSAIRTGELLSRASVAMARWAASGFGRVSDEVHEKRMDACRGCEHLSLPSTSKLYRLTGTAAREKSVCGLCGCDVRRKTKLPTESCPDGRWAAESD